MRALITPCLMATMLTACAALHGRGLNDADATHLVPARAVMAGPTQVVRITQPVASPQLRPLPSLSGQRAVPPGEALRTANRQARQRATPASFIEAIQVYDYLPGALFEVWCAPLHVTSIMLQPGERVIDTAAGDTVRWTIGRTYTGAGAAQQALVLLKPVRPLIQTNLVVTTDRHVYNLEAKAVPGDVYNAAIEWNYPADAARDAMDTAAKAASQDAGTVAAGIDPARLNFDYTITTEQGSEPRWKPSTAFDDGAKTYIEFPPDLGTLTAPPLFVLENGKADLVNYRIKGRTYVVDRLIDRAELRLGENPQTIVRIERQG